MTCNDVIQLLERSVERRESADLERCEPHLGECSECRGRVADHRLLETALAHWNDSEDGPDLTQRVLADLRRPFASAPVAGAGSGGGKRGRVLASVASAAVAAVAVVAIGLITAPKETSDDTGRGYDEVSRTVTDEPPVDYDSLVADTRTALGSLMNETDRSLGGFTALVPQRSRPAPAKDGNGGDSAGRELARQLGNDLKPLGNQLRGSFAFLIGE